MPNNILLSYTTPSIQASISIMDDGDTGWRVLDMFEARYELPMDSAQQVRFQDALRIARGE